MAVYTITRFVASDMDQAGTVDGDAIHPHAGVVLNSF